MKVKATNKYKELNLIDNELGRMPEEGEEFEVSEERFKVLTETNKFNEVFVEKVDETNDTSNYTIKLNSKEVTLPLYVRNRRDGDKIKLKGLNAYKKVSEIFINEKIKTSDRNSWPVVLDSKEEIVWLPGLKKSNLDKKNTEEYDIILRYY